MKTTTALAGGLAGTLVVALIQETLKKITPDAPRMELLDMEALSKMLESINVEVPGKDQLLPYTLAGEIISHTLYYSIAARGNKKNVWVRGILLGLVAGITAVVLPKPLGLDGAPGNRSPQTEAMTIGMYVAGGLAASAICRSMTGKENG